MSTKVAVTLNVDSEVKGIGQALIDLAKDIKAQAAIGKYVGDLSADLASSLTDLQNLSADVMANPDDRAYIGMALEQVADAFMFTAAAPAPVPAPVAP